MSHCRRLLTASVVAARQGIKLDQMVSSRRLMCKNANASYEPLSCAYRTLHTQSVRYSESWLQRETRKEYALTAEEFKKAVDDDSIYVVDVREPFEVAEGRVPAKQYVNLPIGFMFFALQMPDDEFQTKFGIRKPTADDNVVFMCLIGVRSTFALQIGQELKYKNSKHYLGGWAEWSEKFPDDIQK